MKQSRVERENTKKKKKRKEIAETQSTYHKATDVGNENSK